MEETCKEISCIRHMQDKKTPKRYTDKSIRSTDSTKDMIVKYCHFCGMHGPITTNCEFMAKLLIANESLNKVDNKLKKELQETFRNEQKKRREKRLKKQTNIIRKLLDTGGSRADIEAVLATIPDQEENEKHSANPQNNDESDDDSSSTSE